MRPRQRIIRERRQYNQWVASQTLEDYALRYTATQARRSSFRVGNTAFGPIAFLACEAIGGAITFSYGFSNTAGAIVAFIAMRRLQGVVELGPLGTFAIFTALVSAVAGVQLFTLGASYIISR